MDETGDQSIVIAVSADDVQEMHDDTSHLLFYLSLMCTFVMVIMCLAGVIGNSLSLFIFTRASFRKRSINILLAALSASDLFLCLLAIPVFSISQLQALVPSLSKLVAANVLLFAYPVTLMLQSMSVWMLVTITIDRYLAVCHPFTVRIYCTTTRALVTIGVIILFSVGYNFVRFWEWTLNTKNSADEMVHLEEVIQPLLRDNRLFMLLYQNIATLITQFFIPLLVLCILNLEVARAILRAGETRRELVASEKREHSTAKMMLFVVIVFIFCYTLSFILNLAEILDGELFRQPIGFLLNDINNILVVINSSSSFIFYTKYSSRYRGQLRTMFIIRHIAARWDCCFFSHHMRSQTGTEYTTITGISGKVSYYEKKDDHKENL
ncbi:hypothetical protein QR680_006550 [Steinernema hermaphroditum]|uniref:G-protein coupled receptors family 1 profile domain-containing protein n=1 Tax=Steinernema hermaphroditum TaxID=289476 RepID=A0AA39LWR1_9BILA|nr:hypothetical protein QR680_006550 [Steinernema hermaphroditum]